MREHYDFDSIKGEKNPYAKRTEHLMTPAKPPKWHIEILKSREKLVAERKAKFSNWSEAKMRIRKQLNDPK